MTSRSEREIKEKLIQHADDTVPDLWSRIECQLNNRPVQQMADCNAPRSHKKRYRYAVASVLIVLVGSVAVVYTIKFPSIPNVKPSPSQVNPSSSSAILFNHSPILFSSLHFPNSSNSLDLGADPSAMLCIKSFSEEDVISSSEIICKATVVNSYVKEYRYDTGSDKFEKNGRLHEYRQSIVYEIRIDDLYYSTKNLKIGERIKVEQNTWVGTSISGLAFILQKNHQYILNLYNYGENIKVYNYVSGNIKRDGCYAMCYPFAPQIEITLDQQYVFHNEWLSLINDKTVDVVWDKDNTSESMQSYFAKKMKLRNDKDFISDYKKMIAKYK